MLLSRLLDELHVGYSADLEALDWMDKFFPLMEKKKVHCQDLTKGSKLFFIAFEIESFKCLVITIRGSRGGIKSKEVIIDRSKNGPRIDQLIANDWNNASYGIFLLPRSYDTRPTAFEVKKSMDDMYLEFLANPKLLKDRAATLIRDNPITVLATAEAGYPTLGKKR